MKIKRGDILYVDLGVQYQGSMQGSMRPVVVVSNNMANRHSTVLTVVPLSTKIFKKRKLPTHVFIFISAYKTEGLEQHSIALCEQVTALNFDRIIEHMGKVDEETLGRITEGVQVQVGVFDRYNKGKDTTSYLLEPGGCPAFYIAASVPCGSMNFSWGGMECHLRKCSQWISGR